MDITKKTFTVTVSLTKNFQSVKITEGFEVDTSSNFDEFTFEQTKTQLKDRLVDEARRYLDQATAQQNLNLDLG